jgi:hypothetical protein
LERWTTIIESLTNSKERSARIVRNCIIRSMILTNLLRNRRRRQIASPERLKMKIAKEIATLPKREVRRN